MPISPTPIATQIPTALNRYNLDQCSISILKTHGVDPNVAFPFIPHGLIDPNACNPTLWGLDVYKILAWKALVFLNWGAGALAILLTVYAGLLYVSGFAKEDNVKTAKKILVACYVGLAIVFSARIILYGTWQAFNDTPGVDFDSVQVNLTTGTPAPAATSTPTAATSTATPAP